MDKTSLRKEIRALKRAMTEEEILLRSQRLCEKFCRSDSYKRADTIYGYLPYEVQKKISEGLDIPMAEIYGVVTFYTQFSIYPKGKFNVAVCLGTACYVKGSGDIIEKFKERLGIEVGQCTDDGKFSLEATRCIGACGLAPVLTVNDDVYGKITADDVDDILSKYM